MQIFCSQRFVLLTTPSTELPKTKQEQENLLAIFAAGDNSLHQKVTPTKDGYVPVDKKESHCQRLGGWNKSLVGVLVCPHPNSPCNTSLDKVAKRTHCRLQQSPVTADQLLELFFLCTLPFFGELVTFLFCSGRVTFEKMWPLLLNSD